MASSMEQIGLTAKPLRQRVDSDQVEHFINFITGQIAIQDLPFGTRKLRLTTGEDIEIPNVIRLLIPSRLVDQYLQFCQEIDFKPLGKSTLLKIISESCGASVRKCMKGLDNYLAEGTRAFDDLKYVVEKLSQAGMPDTKVTDLKNALLEGKKYLKGDYKVLEQVCKEIEVTEFESEDDKDESMFLVQKAGLSHRSMESASATMYKSRSC
ncbi:hypothetical protein QZH41_003741 [Actinostola sp. cb2023]|nr:hypothetical protein QZH41_003741 [Actinostola sp. cb2023]